MPKRAAIHTLGCRLNQAESALLAGRLQALGFELVDWGAPAELLVLNSCTVTGAAARKTRNLLRAARRRFPDAWLVLTGCEAQLAAAAAWAQAAGANAVVPNSLKTQPETWLPPAVGATLLEKGAPQTPSQNFCSFLRIPQAARGRLAMIGAVELPAESAKGTNRFDGGFGNRLSSKGGSQAAGDATGGLALFREAGVGLFRDHTRANLKAQDGCDCHCAYCIIPQVRGGPRSRELADAVRETRELVARGHREIVVTGVNLGLYRDGAAGLPELLAALAALPGDFRLRLSSLEPGPAVAPVLELMRRQPDRFCRFLHLPLQYGYDAILRAMGRPYTVAEFATLAEQAVTAVPGLCLGTDVIAGLPGETDAVFDECLAFVQRLPLAYLHVFPFSPRPGTRAAAMPGRPPERLAGERCRRLTLAGDRLAAAFRQSQLGRRATVLVEEQRDAAGHRVGLSDNYLRVSIEGGPGDPAPGTWCEVRLAEATPDGTLQGRCGL
ncbi:MAG: radical SAM protein [Lentisphaeria bacterium]